MRLSAALLTVSLAILASSGCATSTASTSAAQPNARALAEDFDLLIGPPWGGTLTYLDYTSNQRTEIRSTLLFARSPAAAGQDPMWQMSIGYNDEPNADSSQPVVLRLDGRMIGDETVIDRTVAPDGSVHITTEEAGEDDNRAAVLRKVYTLSTNAASLQSLVRLKGESEFFERHIYRWTR